MKESNIAIASTLKSRKIKVREPIEERCWAFMKALRERSATKRVYDLDPYVEVYRLRENLYALLSEHLGGAGDVWSYLLLGPEKALLIDTALGVGDLKGLCDQLTGGLPLLVAVTHAHGDHASGNCQFERVYCHEYSVPALEKMRTPRLWDAYLNADGQPVWTAFDRADIVPFHEYDIVGCPDGTLFNLGGDHDVELIWTAGHQPGHCMFLDKKGRLLFAGDDVISMRIQISGGRPGEPYGEFATVEAYRDQMAKLAARLDEFDYVFPAHFVFDLENYVVADLVAAAAAILADPQSAERSETVEWGGQTMTRYHKYVKGLGTLAYTLDAVRK
jgi:glyoxylase-like metal-dependent hydrolase (beta-lactamase superfamily II)